MRRAALPPAVLARRLWRREVRERREGEIGHLPVDDLKTARRPGAKGPIATEPAAIVPPPAPDQVGALERSRRPLRRFYDVVAKLEARHPMDDVRVTCLATRTRPRHPDWRRATTRCRRGFGDGTAVVATGRPWKQWSRTA